MQLSDLCLVVDGLPTIRMALVDPVEVDPLTLTKS